MTNAELRMKTLFTQWKKIQGQREILASLQKEKRLLDKRIRQLAQMIPKLLDAYNDSV